MANQRNDLTENRKKSEPVLSCRLFGIDLMKPSAPVPKEEDMVQDVKVTNIFAEEHGPSSEATTDSEQKSDLSKLSQEKKPSLPLLSPKDTQSKLGPSSRTRTKVWPSFLIEKSICILVPPPQFLVRKIVITVCW